MNSLPIDELTDEELFNKKIIVEILKNINQGLGLAKISGKVTFIPYVVESDIVEIKITKNRSKYMEGKVINIIQAAKDRVKPKCKVFTKCGGCWYQHINYEKELELKKSFIVDILYIVGHLRPEVLDVIPSPKREGYRNHIQIKSSIKKELGFFKPKKIMVEPIPEEGCLLIPKEMNEFVKNLNKQKYIIPHINYRIRQNYKNEVYISGLDKNDAKYFYEKVGQYKYRIGIHNFFQVNRYQIENWLNVILKYVNYDKKIDKKYNTIIDLYCGVGLISFSLSEHAEKVIGIEINKNSIKDAKYSMELNNISNINFLTKKAYEALKDIKQADIIVIDPPRAGCKKEVINEILNIKPEKIIYVSCNPSTFSRDCRYLVDGGYELRQVQPIDMFPFTYHIEIIGLLVKNS